MYAEIKQNANTNVKRSILDLIEHQNIAGQGRKYINIYLDENSFNKL